MPTYDYACDSCGHRFEAVQKMSDAALTTCPECGKSIRRVLTGGIAISFKGSGFYVNDAKGASTDAKKGGSCAASGGTSSGDAKASTACASCPAAASGQ